ncbi:MAG: histidinol dehydrogenase, partial [Ferruginibacter sp.]
MKKVLINPERIIWEAILKRPVFDYRQLELKVLAMLEDVQTNTDAAVKKYTAQFDAVDLNEFAVSINELAEATSLIDEKLKEAIAVAKNNITVFHQSQKEAVNKIETTTGVVCWRKSVAIEKVGLYIPGGT